MCILQSVLDIWWTATLRSNVWLLELNHHLSMWVHRKVIRITIQESAWKRQWQESVTWMTSITWQPLRAQGCSVQSVGWPREKHVLNVPGMAVVRNYGRLWLSQVSDSWYFPISGQIFVGKCGGPRSTAGRRCLGSVKALSEDATQLSAQPYAGMQGGTSHLHHPCPTLQALQWCPGAWHWAACLLPTQLGHLRYIPLCKLRYIPLCKLSPVCWEKAVIKSVEH